MWDFSTTQLIMKNFSSEPSGFDNIFYHSKSNMCPLGRKRKIHVYFMVLMDCSDIFSSLILVVGLEQFERLQVTLRPTVF